MKSTAGTPSAGRSPRTPLSQAGEALGLRAATLAVCLLLLLPLSTPAADPAPIGVRVGNHAGFGRVVFDVPHGTRYRLEQHGNRIVVHFDPPRPVADAPALPHNVRSLTGGDDAVVELAPGATMHTMRLGDHVVIDAYDPQITNPAQPAGIRSDGRLARPSRATSRLHTLEPKPSGPSLASSPHATPSGPARSAVHSAVAANFASQEPATAAITTKPAIGATPPEAVIGPPPRAKEPHPALGAEKTAALPAPAPARSTPAHAGPGTQPRQAGGSSVASDTGQPASAHSAATFPPPPAPKNTASPPPKPAPRTTAKATPGSSPASQVTIPAASLFKQRPVAASPAAPAPPPPVAPASSPASQRLVASVPSPAQTAELRAAGFTMEAGQVNGHGSVATPVVSEPATGPLGLIAQLLPPSPGKQGAAFFVPFPPGAGAAAFRLQDTGFVVFDEARPLDLHALRRDRLFSTARVYLAPAATVIRLHLPPGLSIALDPTRQGWTVTVLADAPHPRPIDEHFAAGRLLLSADAPGKVVTIADPETGATLLVGTQHRTGEAVAIQRVTPDFALLPSWQGVPVEALSDRLMLRVLPTGFALGAEPGGLAISPLDDEALADAAVLTRRFRFPRLPAVMLRQQIAAGQDKAAAAPPLSRGPLRVAIARDMIALGLGPEAEALLRLAMEQDPNQAASADTVGLTAIAALLADRPEEADGITDPRLTGSDEVTFWRTVRLALRDDASPQAAASFAITGPLALAYPTAMRNRLLPLVAETMLRGGRAKAAEALLARCGAEPKLGVARAMALEAEGKADAALAAYDRLARSPDQLTSARAAVSALELRLKLGRISARQAADGLDRLLYAWRGDRRDLAVRERLAALRRQTGAWRAAFTVLRDAERDFPAARAELQTRLRDMFAALLRGHAIDRMAPLDFVALVDENVDLQPASAEGEALQAHLADRLLALDLVDQAAPVLKKLMLAAPTPAGRAEFGERLAALRLREGDAGGALNALLTSAAGNLPAGLASRRRLLFAAATAQRGDIAGALAAIADLDTAAAAAERADIQEQAQDWWGADRALTDYVAKTVPASGNLDGAQRRTLLRLATDAARAGDAGTLAGLNARETVRMGTGPLADMFRVLTEAPVRGTGDLPRAQREAVLAGALPADLKALRPAPATR